MRLNVGIPLLGLFAAAVAVVVTGPWPTHDEREYAQLSKVATHTVLRRMSAIKPEPISRCLENLPPSMLNLTRLQAGPAITLANPVQHTLITISEVRGRAQLVVHRPPGRSLRSLHRQALISCSP